MFSSLASASSGTPKEPTSEAVTSVTPSTGNPVQDLSNRLASVAAAVPGFGGLSRDTATGKLVVHLTDSNQRAAAEQAITTAFGNKYTKNGITIKEATYRFEDLNSWYAKVLNNVLGTAGVVLVDLDESNNRLMIGVSNEESAQRIKSMLTRLNIPLEAVRITQAGGLTDEATLQQSVRPVVGGVAATSGTECTLGFNADRGTVRGFVTASHCTPTLLGYDGRTFYQPWIISSSAAIGTEYRDPGTSMTGCPTGCTCRYTDSAFIQYNSTTTSTRGRIAKPDANLNIVGNYRIVDWYVALTGDTLHMVGAKTGLDSVTVVDTCIALQDDVKKVIYECLNVVTETVIGGDSGAPYFLITDSPNTGDVEIEGIHRVAGWTRPVSVISGHAAPAGDAGPALSGPACLLMPG